MEGLSLEPQIPSPLWVALAVAAVALIAWYARRKPTSLSRDRWASIVGLMSCSLAAVLVMLLNPTWVRPVPPPAGKPLVTVLVDATASMATPDADERPKV